MLFKAASIAGVEYSEAALPAPPDPAQQQISEFLTALALCHTVQVVAGQWEA